MTYVRWGRTTCPNATGTELVYCGRAAGTSHGHQGGTSDYLCLPEQPEYISFTPGTQGDILLYMGQSMNQLRPTSCNNSPECSMCYICLMIPARVSCPASWTLEYSGYLMTEHYSQHRRSRLKVYSYPLS